MASMPKFEILSAFFMLCLSFASAERDFNFNDSQISLLEPKDEPINRYNQDPYAAEVARCHYTESEMVLSLVLKNHDWSNMSEVKKGKVLNKLSKFFAIPKEFIILESVTKRELYEMQKQSIRKGNNKCHSNRRLGRVDLMIGCGPKYFSMGEPIANQIGQQMKDGSIDNITGEKFGWWIIWRKSNKSRAQRSRRQALEGSGEDDYEDDSYDYDEDEEDIVEPVTEIPTTTTHAHRHHHGASKEEGGEESDVTLRPDGNEIPIAHFNFSSTNISIPNIPNTPNITLLTDFFNELSSFLSSSTQPPTTIVTIPTTSSTTTPATTTTTTSLPPETSTQMSSSVSTDYVEPKVENTPPMIKTRLQKFAVASGKAFRYIVPAETFFDNEDLSNLRLELTDKDGHELKPSSWLQFNAETHEIYGLPLDDTVSKYTYRLSATDSGNLSVTETLEMSVQQHRGVRSVNHEINIAVKINEKHMPNIDWQMKLIRAIATTLGDETTNNLVVREIRQTQQDPTAATFIYFNETLPTTECPDAELNNLIQRLDVTRLADLLYPTLGIKSITGQLVGPCQKQHISNKAKLPTNMSKNLPPMPRNQVDRVNATVGHLLVFKVPSDTFYDPNDNELTLTLKTKDNRELSPRHWLQFDTKNQEFYGIPKSGDIGSEEYLLVAEDNGGLTAADALVVVVNHAPKKEFSAYFKAYLAIRHEQFNADLQRKFVERLTQLFGDHTTQFIQIRSITTHHDADATIVNFYNTTLHKTHNRCPEEEIEATRNVYLMQDYMVRDRVKQALGPELNVTNVQVIPLGSCHPQPNVIHHDIIPTKTDEPTLKSTFAENYLFTFIVPAVIIVVLILVASVIACCLHRRRMSGKMELGDEEERKSFRPKGIPVIFQDELDEKPEIGNKSPIILKDEKPPLLPPSYNTSNMNGENDVDEYVPPPAVVVGGREARGKSPATPSYRKPPPYVSP